MYEDDEDIKPEDFFGAERPIKQDKAGEEEKKEEKAEKSKSTPKKRRVIGYPAGELPTVAPKKFNYRAVMHHNEAKDPGSKEIPEGAPNCLEGSTFVITGEFTGLTREQLSDLIKTYGGRVTSAVSGKTTYLVVGDDPGSSKIDKAKSKKTWCLNEDDLLELIADSRISDDFVKQEEEHHEVPIKETQALKMSSSPPAAEPMSAPSPEPAPVPVKQEQAQEGNKDDEYGMYIDIKPKQRESQVKTKPTPAPAAVPSETDKMEVAELWTEKYKPTRVQDLCGHKTAAEEIVTWLEWWASGSIPEKRAVLISGPPGIGKTTTAHLVAKLSGFDVLELNASETRSKKTLQSLLGGAISNRSILEFDRRSLQKMEEDGLDGEAASSGSKRLVVIMDEVDGMSGGDRGGSTELIQMIKRTKVPIICICNDRMSPKVRTLSNHCEDMRFRRPTEAQMKARLSTIAFREGLELGPNVIGQLVKSTHNDIRQIINIMSSYSLSKKSMNYMDSKEYSQLNKKEVSIGPFDVIGKYMNGGENTGLSFADKLDLYYSDFSIIPLFVQENYIDNKPCKAQNTAEVLERLSRAADSIADADVVDNKLRGSQQWGLMPLHAALSCVAPAYEVCGSHNGMYRFPLWLGQNSKGMRMARLLREVQSHMRLRVPTDKTEIRKSYVPAMVPELVTPLIKDGADGIGKVMDTMDHYYLTKDHWDAMLELHMDSEKMLKKIPTTVKSAFTREYKKANHPVAFQTLAGVKSAASAAASSSVRPDTEDVVDDDFVVDDDENEEDEDEDSVDKDGLINSGKPNKKGKTKAKPKARASSSGGGGSGRRKKSAGAK